MNDDRAHTASPQPQVIRRYSPHRLSRTARNADKGAFLADSATNGFAATVNVTVRTEKANVQVAQALAINHQDTVLVRQRVMSVDDEVVQLATSRLATKLTKNTPIEQTDAGPGGTYAVLEKLGYQLGHFVETVTCRVATSEENVSLALAPNNFVLVVTRIAYDVHNQPLEITDMIMAGHRYELVYEIPAI